MGKQLHKNNRLTIRFSADQAKRLERAARSESTRRGEVVEESTLVRELVMPRIDEILAAAELQAAAPAA